MLYTFYRVLWALRVIILFSLCFLVLPVTMTLIGIFLKNCC